MKLGDALHQYRCNRQKLVDRTRSLVKKKKAAEKKFEATGDVTFADEAATLQLSIEANEENFKKNQEVLDNLTMQYTAEWNAEVARQQSDPETGYAAELGKIMTTVARMCAGDKVPLSDEQKVREYDSELYMKAKMAQSMMAAMKKKQKEYDSLWNEDEEEKNKYDPEAAAENAEFAGVLPDIEVGEAESAEAPDISIE
jgi:predicted unusual protein kinase regulating ubiquinone biosynthesis (AarF/ABC1/UbiB family)